MGNVTVSTLPPNIVETNTGLVCLNIDTAKGTCETWAIMKQPEPLLPRLKPDEINLLTGSVLSVIALAWVFTIIKRVIQTI